MALGEGQVWSYGFLRARTSDGRLLRFLTALDEYGTGEFG